MQQARIGYSYFLIVGFTLLLLVPGPMVVLWAHRIVVEEPPPEVIEQEVQAGPYRPLQEAPARRVPVIVHHPKEEENQRDYHYEMPPLKGQFDVPHVQERDGPVAVIVHHARERENQQDYHYQMPSLDNYELCNVGEVVVEPNKHEDPVIVHHAKDLENHRDYHYQMPGMDNYELCPAENFKMDNIEMVLVDPCKHEDPVLVHHAKEMESRRDYHYQMPGLDSYRMCDENPAHLQGSLAGSGIETEHGGNPRQIDREPNSIALYPTAKDDHVQSDIHILDRNYTEPG